MSGNGWLRIIKPVSPKDLPENFGEIIYQVDGGRQNVLSDIEDYRAMLAGAAGETRKA